MRGANGCGKSPPTRKVGYVHISLIALRSMGKVGQCRSMRRAMTINPSAWLRYLVLLSALLMPTRLPADDNCQPYHYVLGFFNGVWNLPDDANHSALALHGVWKSTGFAPTLQRGPALEVFYN